MAETASSTSIVKRICPQCRQVFPSDASFCPHDGVPLIDRSRTFSSLDEETEDPKKTLPPEPGKEVDVTPGMVIGDYRVEHLIGEGGMGKIFAAIHPVIRKRVAIKVLNRRYAQDAKAIARFVLEARSVNEVGHHNIVDIFSIGELDDGRNYFIMELLDGLGLDEILDRIGRLAPGQLLPVFEQLCDALEAAHTKGFVHRDLKPANVIVLRRPPYPFIKILDFGLAKLRGSATGFETKVGTVLGTPEYMAPEQCRGDQVDERTDIYALGVMLYELVTGRKPFFDPSPFKILVLQQGEPPRPPSELSPISPELERVILKALSKDAGMRHASAGALLEDLRRAIPAPEPWVVDVKAPPPPTPPPTPSPGHRPPEASHRTMDGKTEQWVSPPATPAQASDSITATIPMGVLNPLDTGETPVADGPENEGLATIPMQALDPSDFPPELAASRHSKQEMAATRRDPAPPAQPHVAGNGKAAAAPDPLDKTIPLTPDMAKSRPSTPRARTAPPPGFPATDTPLSFPAAPAASSPPSSPGMSFDPGATSPRPTPVPVDSEATFEPVVSTSLVSARRRQRSTDEDLSSLVVRDRGRSALFWIVLTTVAVAFGMSIALLLSLVV